MDYSNELASLVRDFRLYIDQNYSTVQTAAEPPRAKAPVAPPRPVAPLPVAKKASPPSAAPVKLPELPKAPVEPIMQAMPRPFVSPALVSLGDCLAKLQNLGISTVDAPIDAPMAKIAECIVISFYSPASSEEAFIQKVANSITERLLPCRLYLQPGLQAAAECFTLAASARAKAFILAYHQEDAPKVAQWLSYFGDDCKDEAQEKLKLAARKSLFGVHLYELVALKSDDPEYKRALWNDIQSI